MCLAFILLTLISFFYYYFFFTFFHFALNYLVHTITLHSLLHSTYTAVTLQHLIYKITGLFLHHLPAEVPLSATLEAMQCTRLSRDLKRAEQKGRIFCLYFVCKNSSKLLCSQVTRIGSYVQCKLYLNTILSVNSNGNFISINLNDIVQIAIVYGIKSVLPIGVFRYIKIRSIQVQNKNNKCPRI